jgi:hypothetical protein
VSSEQEADSFSDKIFMMFRRKVQKNIGMALQDLVWPRMGWSRVYTYWRHRLFRNGDSTYRITAGLASGAAVSFSPFIGTHILQSFVLARILRANWIAAVAGTLWGNPWTFPFIFAASYISGAWILNIFGIESISVLPDHINFDCLIARPGDFFAYLFGHPLELLLPMTIGSLMVGTIFWLVAYSILYYPVFYARRAYRRQRLAMRARFRRLRQKDHKQA